MSEKYSKEKQNEILLSIAENFDNTNELLKAFNMPMLNALNNATIANSFKDVGDDGFDFMMSKLNLKELQVGCISQILSTLKILHHFDLNPNYVAELIQSTYLNKSKTPKEVIEAMLDSGIYNEVLAYVSDEPIEYIGNKHQVALIYNIDLNGKFVESSNDNEYSYAVSYCHKSGKIIVDYVDGKEILDD